MSPRPDRFATIVALLIVATVIGTTIRSSIFTAWGADSAGYLAAGRDWAAGELFAPASLVFWAPWAIGGQIEAPLGHRVGPIKGTIVGEYPLGYPLLLAAAIRIEDDFGPFVVAPLFAGLLCWCVFLLATPLGSPWSGVMASALMAGSPITLLHATQPMSDVPAAALWALGWVFALRPGMGAAVASGVSAAAAITVRPNLAPLVLVLASVVLWQNPGPLRKRWHRLAGLVVAASIGAALVLASQSVLYGHPLTPGYVGYQGFFSTSRIPENALLYPSLLADLHTALPFAGLMMVVLATRPPRESLLTSRALVVTLAAVGFVLVNYLPYLPYLTFRGWDSIRFLLPAFTALVILFAGFLDRVRIALATHSRLLAIIAILPAMTVMLAAHDEVRSVFASAPAFRRVQMMGHYLRETAPQNAAILSFLPSGTVAVYVGRMVVRLDLIDPPSLDNIVDDLERRGYRPAFLIDDFVESQRFRARFQGSRYQQLDWAPRAQFASPTQIRYMETADRDRYLRGERWSIDFVD